MLGIPEIQTEFMSIKQKIASGFKIKEYCDKAYSILREEKINGETEDATLEYLLGRWCFRIASISWIERKLASSLLTEVPDARLYF